MNIFSRRFRAFVMLLAPCLFLAGTLYLQGQEATASAPIAIPVSAADWGLSFQTEGAPPVGNATAEELAQYNACYVGDTSKKIIYLTFDCGYENGFTEPILDTLKKHNAPAAFRQELEELSALYRETVGTDMPMYYRPPQGKYSLENLKQAHELGYQTVFWSLAYVDWYVDDQPTAEEAYAKLLPRIHDGAIVLLHSTSRTNAEILDDLLTKWEEMGYSFASLKDLPNPKVSSGESALTPQNA